MSLGSAYIPHVIIGVIAVIIITIIVMTLIHSYFKSKNSSTLIFASYFALAGFWALGSTFFPIFEPMSFAYAFAVIAISASYLGFYALFLFLELINFDKINMKRAIFFATLVSVTIVLMMFNPYSSYLRIEYINEFGYLTRPSTLFSILQAIILLGIGFEYIITAYRVKKVAVTPAQKNQAIWFIVGAICGVFGNIIASILRGRYRKGCRYGSNYKTRLFLRLVSAVSMVLQGMAFTKDPDVAFVLPFEVQSLMVLNNYGMNLYTRIFDSKLDVDENLTSSMISAITLFMQEALGIKSELEEIIFRSRHILLDIREKIWVFIVANLASKTLKIALKKFTDYFVSKFSKFLEDPVINYENFKPAMKGVEKYFGFLPGDWKTQ